MTEYVVTDSELRAIANAIRSKGGTSDNLEWYSDFVDAISDISGGNSLILYPPIKIAITSSSTNPLKIINGWVGEFESGYQKMIPTDLSGNPLDVDWSNPFEICVSFIRTGTSSHAMVLFGCDTTSWFHTPSVELGNNNTDISCWFSSNGTSWTNGITFGASDGFNLQSNKKYSIKYIYDGNDFTAVLIDGNDIYAKSVKPSGGHYHNSSHKMVFGGMMSSNSHNLIGGKLYLPDMYISSNGVKVWESTKV